MKIDDNKIYSLINRLNYTRSKQEMLNDEIVNHIKKVYNPNAYLYSIMMDIIFYNTPKSIYNLVNYALNNCYNKELTVINLLNIFEKIDIKLTEEYRNINLIQTLHPWINKELQYDINKVLTILLSKALDDKDNYFNKCSFIEQKINPFDIIEKYEDFIKKIKQFDFALSGSIALSFYGDVYRTYVKDFDFVANSNLLGTEILNNINNEIQLNNIVGKNRLQIETYLKSVFPRTELGKRMKDIFGNDLELLTCIIDRVSQYDSITKATFIFKYKEIEFDIIFKDNFNYNNFNISVGNIKVQTLEDIIYNKKLLSRYKDFKDLINFKPYNKNER